MKLTNTKLTRMIAEEKVGAREYHHYGLHNLAADEEHHARILEDLKRRMQS